MLTAGLLQAYLIIKLFGKESVEETTDKDGKKIKNVSFDREQSTIYWICIRSMQAIFAKTILFATGARVTEKKLKISDFFADYGKYEEKNKNLRAPIMISNHVTVFDFAFFTQSYQDNPSSLVLSFIRKVPFLGKIVEAQQGIFIDNKSSDNRLKSFRDIKTRINNIMDHKNFPHL